MLKQMLVRTTSCLLLAGIVLGAADTASAQQTLNFNIGYFAVAGADDPRDGVGGRVGADCTTCRRDVDVLIANRDFLTFDIDEFNGLMVGGEWLVPLGEWIEAGAGLSFYRRTVPSVYTNYVEPDRSEVEQKLQLRMIPIDFTVRVLPLGISNPVQPYVGAGLGITKWRYREFGEFINFDAGQTIYTKEFVADGTSTGPVILGGVRFADGGLSVGGEVRYRKAEGEVGDDFAGSLIDLGGWTFQGTIGFRFGR